jgi:hypothetical protein
MSEDKQDDPAQSQRFVDMAREVEAERCGNYFDRVFGRLAHTKKPTSIKNGQEKRPP